MNCTGRTFCTTTSVGWRAPHKRGLVVLPVLGKHGYRIVSDGREDKKIIIRDIDELEGGEA